jgi:DinB superfamily
MSSSALWFSRACARRAVAVLALTALTTVAAPAPAKAQGAMSPEAAAIVRTTYLADLEVLRGKFVGLAQAFPPDKYTWRPMDGVRSVSEVLMLIAMEGYAFVPSSFGGKPADLGSREEAAKLRTLSDKTAVLDHLNKAFAHAKRELEAVDLTALSARHKVMGQDMSALDAATAIGGDMHEHLGQLIAYARMNHIVPPWSK